MESDDLRQPQDVSEPICHDGDQDGQKTRGRATRAEALNGRAATAIVLLAGSVLATCSGDPPPAAGRGGGEHFRTVRDGRPVELVLDDCEVFLVRQKEPRERVLSTDFYPMFSVCVRQEIVANDDYITVILGRQAIGAGGCCATGGTWRSRDGRNWERREHGRWVKAPVG